MGEAGTSAIVPAVANAIFAATASVCESCRSTPQRSSNRRDMLAELRDDSKQAAASLREARGLCDEHGDVASASLLEVWIDQAARRT